MIYALIGTDREKREKANVALLRLGIPTTHIYSEQIALLEPLTEASSLFGEKIIALLVQTMDVAGSKEIVTNLLPEMKVSETIFIIDEPFADANKAKRLEKYAEKMYDCREEKEESVSPFPLCNAFGRRDKKQAFIEWMNIRDMADSMEMVHGALWWKMKTIWEDTLTGKPTKWSKEECERTGSNLIRATMDAYRGKGTLREHLEKIILSV